MGDAVGVQSGHRAAGHAVVLRIDHVERLAGVNDGLGDGSGSGLVPVGGLLGDIVPAGLGVHLLVQRTGTAQLGVGTHVALNVDDVVLVQVLGGQPIHGGLALGGHVGDDGGGIHALVSFQHTVEEDDLGAGGLGVLEHGVPAGGGGGGEEEEVHLVLDHLLRGSNLLGSVVVVVEGGLIAVVRGEGVPHGLVVGGAVAGLVGVVVDDAHSDGLAGRRLCRCGWLAALRRLIGIRRRLVVGGLVVGGLIVAAAAAGGQGQDHAHGKQETKDFFHNSFLTFKFGIRRREAGPSGGYACIKNDFHAEVNTFPSNQPFLYE